MNVLKNLNKNELKGTYRHYKGGIYYVDRLVTHTETNELLVFYYDDENTCWVRPYDMFFSEAPQGEENVTNQKNRFEKINLATIYKK